MHRKIVIIILISAILAIVIISKFLLSEQEEKMEMSEPGIIKVTTYNDFRYQWPNNYTIEFNNNSINVTLSYYRSWDDIEKGNVSFISKEYNRSVGEDIWYPLMRCYIEDRGNDPPTECCCLADKLIEMIDKNGKLVVIGKYNSHKHHVYVGGTFTRVFVDKNSDLEFGTKNLEDLLLHF